MSHLAPRIGFTCWHTILRRWTTASRTGRKGQCCLLGCTDYEDSVEHYAKCRIAREWAATRMQLRYDHRNSLHMWTLTAHFPFMIYATYRATNHFRHNGTNTDPNKQKEETKEYLNQIIHTANLGQHRYKLFEEHNTTGKNKKQKGKKTNTKGGQGNQKRRATQPRTTADSTNTRNKAPSGNPTLPRKKTSTNNPLDAQDNHKQKENEPPASRTANSHHSFTTGQPPGTPQPQRAQHAQHESATNHRRAGRDTKG